MSGELLTKDLLYRQVRQRVRSNNSFFLQHLDSSRANYPNSFHKFVTRVMKAEGWTNRCATVSQTVPINWRELSISCARRIRDNMRSAKVDALIAPDEVSTWPLSLSCKL